MAGILVFGELAGSELAPASLELVAAATPLARDLGEPVLGALVGGDVSAASTQFHGLSALYWVSGVPFKTYTATATLAAAEAIIRESAPSVVLFPHNLQTREWVPQLAARLDTGLVLDCTRLAMENGQLVVIKPVYGGNVLGEFVIHGSPRLATIRGGVHDPIPSEKCNVINKLTVTPPTATAIRLLGESAALATGGPRLKDAKAIVSGGRGVGGPENWYYIETAAAALDAAVGCSRPVADSGWVPSSHQVGLSGTSVKPDLYVAVGISGAIQHLAGISAAKTVIAINTAADADIFTRANYGVVGDYREVLPAFVERVRQLRS